MTPGPEDLISKDEQVDRLLIEGEKRKASRGRFANIAHKRRVTDLYKEYRLSPAQFTMTFEEFKRSHDRARK